MKNNEIRIIILKNNNEIFFQNYPIHSNYHVEKKIELIQKK